MRVVSSQVLAAVALCATAFVAPSATGETSSEVTTGAGGTRAAATQTGAAGTATQSQPAKRKVWTNADLVALRKDPSTRIMVLESKRIGRAYPQIRNEPAVRPQDVVDRYAALAKEAETKLSELEREKLAASNPFLRGLASQTGGPRAPAEIEADLTRWASRRDSAKSNLERASRLTGAQPTTSTPR